MGCAKKFGSQIGFHSHANVTFAKCFSYFSYRSNCCCCCAYSKKKIHCNLFRLGLVIYVSCSCKNVFFSLFAIYNIFGGSLISQ